MEYPVSYYDDEIREGFYVSGLMKRMWAAQLEVYLDVVKVCEKHHIRWFADYGSLLGAVRHGGYIPWDDDFDICMLRDDYTKFIEVAEAELPDHYLIKNCHTIKEDFLTRIDNNRVPCFDEEFLKKYHNCYLVAGIDIFPLDYMAPEGEEEKAHKFLLQAILSFRDFFGENMEPVEMETLLVQLEQLSGKKFDRNATPIMQVYQAAEAVCSVYGPKQAKSVMLAAVWATSGTKTYPISCFKNTIMMPFEGIEIPVSAEYDTMLQLEYRNYMDIVKGGASHEYPCFREQEEFCVENIPDYPFLYKYNPDDLKDIPRLPSNKLSNRAKKFATLMEKAHSQMLAVSQKNNYDSVFQLFETCQNGAINIGTCIEENYGDGFSVVKILEEYCEALYQLSVLLNDSENPFETVKNGCKELDCIIERFIDGVNEYMHDKREILIMPYRASTWSVIEPIWSEYNRNEDCHVSVLIPPYYERSGAGGFTIMHDESGDLPAYVEVTAYDAYDFEGIHPDVIITQNPYDECNYTTSVHPFFYTKNLKQYTDKLIYIPWFVMDEFDLSNGKSYQTMQYFCTVPGLFHADEVLLQSEQMRKNYIERLTEFAGEETRYIWEQKIKGTGISKIEIQQSMNGDRQQVVEAKIPTDWHSVLFDKDDNKKSIVVYDITPQAFSQGGKNAIERVKSTIRIFEENKDNFVLIWRNNSITRDSLYVTDRRLAAEYEQLIKVVKDSEWGIYDETLTYQEEAYLADAYYGDTGYVARFFETLGKPVMIQDVEPMKKVEMIEKPELRLDSNGNIPFHIRASVCVGDDLYVFPDEINALCKIHMLDGQIELISSIPEEGANTISLVSKLEYYNGKIILIPYNARCPWLYDIENDSWTPIRVEREEQNMKFSTSLVYKDKLFMFPNWYKYITCVDLNTGRTTYFNGIYNDFLQHNIHEQCVFKPDYALNGDTVVLLNYSTNLVLVLNLETAEYKWKFVGEKSQQFNSIIQHNQEYILIPRMGDAIIKWDGDKIEEYKLPQQCQFIYDGLISGYVIDGKLKVKGYNSSSVEADVDDLQHIKSLLPRYRYIVRCDDMMGCYYNDRYEVETFDGKVFKFETVYKLSELKDYIKVQISKNTYNLKQIVQEDDVVDIGLFMDELRMSSDEKKKIVFMPYNASMWDSLESIWLSAKEDENCDVKVVPIPYYDKDGKGELKDYHYEGVQFPKYVPITDYREYNLENEKPDVIYIHNPYDNGNHVISVDPKYYSAELKKHADKLVYVPYYATAGGMSAGQALCRAYIYADYIVVQAEKYKGYFDSKIQREKLLAFGSPKFDKVIRLCANPPAMPKEWERISKGRRVFFYNTSLHGMLDDTEAFLKKMRYVFSCFEDRTDVCLLWRPHPLLETTIQSSRAEFLDEYCEIKSYFMEHHLGIYDTSFDIEKTIALCDAYIGDSGTSVTSLFGVAGKPMFILNNAIHRVPKQEDVLQAAITPYLDHSHMDWKIIQGNKLYFAKNHDYQYQYYCDLSEYAGGDYYKYVIQRDEGVYVFPLNAQDILFVDWSKNIRKISLERKNEQPWSFDHIEVTKDYVFLIPCRYPYIVRFNMATQEIDYIDGCQSFVANINSNEVRVGGSTIWNGYLLIASPVDKRVIAIDCENLELQVLEVDAKRYRGACAMAALKDEVWLLPYTSTNVVRWNPITGDTREYNCRVEGFKCFRRPQGISCMEKAFGSLVEIPGGVLLAPLWGNQFVKIDTTKDEVSVFDINVDLEFHKNDSYIPSFGQGYFLSRTSNNKVLFYHDMNRMLYEIEIGNEAATEKNIVFDIEELKEHEAGFSRISEWMKYACMENALCSLSGFLDKDLLGNEFDKEEQIKAFGEIAENIDGTCGEKIHRYVMSTLYKHI